MTNAPFETLEDFRDIESINAYHEFVQSGIVDASAMMRYIRYKGRDNARTPMQWDDGVNAGFSAGTPWIMVNPNYKEINAEEQLSREDSVFRYYQKLIRLRRKEEIIVSGTYELLLPDSEELYVYTRTSERHKLLVVCSFTEDAVPFTLPAEFKEADAEVLISNYNRDSIDKNITLKPYEAFVLKI